MWPAAPSVFAYLRRAMPLYAPKTLTAPEVYALTAWILWRNGLIGEAEPMSRAALPAVVMPGRARIVPAWPADPDRPGP